MTTLIKIKNLYLKGLDADNEIKKTRQELREAILEARQERYTYEAIAEILQITPQAVGQFAKYKGK